MRLLRRSKDKDPVVVQKEKEERRPGFQTRAHKDQSRHKPHQGKSEKARRCSRLELSAG
jgi:hypothetical protein